MITFEHAILVVGVLAFTTSVIVQVIKEMVDHIPTNLVVFCVSLITTIAASICFFGYTKCGFHMYYVIIILFLSFFVANVSMLGWKNVCDLWKRLKQPEE